MPAYDNPLKQSILSDRWVPSKKPTWPLPTGAEFRLRIEWNQSRNGKSCVAGHRSSRNMPSGRWSSPKWADCSSKRTTR